MRGATYHFGLPEFGNRVDTMELDFNGEWVLERLVLALEDRPQEGVAGGRRELWQIYLDILWVE